MTKPVQSYILCTSPRSGSTLLCGLLKATQCCGLPDSHFHEPSLEAWLGYYDLEGVPFASHSEAVRAALGAARAYGRGKTDMFGLRLQQHSAVFFFQQLAQLHPRLDGDVARIDAVFGRTAYLYLTRENKLDQAISYLKAEQSGLWHRAPDGTEIERLAPHRDPVYDRAALGQQIALFEAYEREWQGWFARQGIRPLTLTYDALAADPWGVLAQILEYLGKDPAVAKTLTLPVAKLADSMNEEWAARYLAEQV
ncbi:Stf0 family sulfotransferase [Roseovarius sp. 2305UL8-3]|uniref:Stf0 family sulfotransferase n=1 Tax=Roseovarius conchicola TaxID=3121636 RepID=UPI0035276EBE